jgi:hypothetical protein
VRVESASHAICIALKAVAGIKCTAHSPYAALLGKYGTIKTGEFWPPSRGLGCPSRVRLANSTGLLYCKREREGGIALAGIVNQARRSPDAGPALKLEAKDSLCRACHNTECLYPLLHQQRLGGVL